MSFSNTGEMASPTSVYNNRTEELKAFDDTKAGVKGLVDAGIVSIPKIFVLPPEELAEEPNSCQKNIEAPIIDLNNIEEGSRRKEIVDDVRIASEKWGFFLVINHGIPLSVLDEMIDGVRMFNEQDVEVKKEVYSRDTRKKVRFNTNYDLYKSRAADWRDTLTISLLAVDLDPELLPVVCRKSTLEYVKHIRKLGDTLFELLSEALGLQADYLGSMECAKEGTLVCHYYPACPQPKLTLGVSRHADPGFLTLLIQNEISGLQVLHEDQWFDVHPIQGGLVVNIGDLLQIVSNERFKSVEHRVIANHVGPRISAPCFFAGPLSMPEKTYSPIQELTSEANPPRYKEIPLREYVARFYSSSLDDEKSPLDYYKP
ncbi:1-aminocyclopropane-1-carboxylate oxidase homolog 1-like [Herrania umbratica]|uniref:1-aminocyclopropane-1-carboxylate oxidase homolog 1-like n=1 Tax=Herrania umbratica TaxID=108875 RepID=A0A6J1AVP0_9ROSI|nr:1-aminocyclopropane-1-carboxylate oxidase homolog 1-like [Herrania umbratica]